MSQQRIDQPTKCKMEVFVEEYPWVRGRKLADRFGVDPRNPIVRDLTNPGYPDPINEAFDDEIEVRDTLIEEMRTNGWQAHGEVEPDNSRKRVDVMAWRPEYGTIALEIKHMSSYRSGASTGKAIRQIHETYRHKRFGGERIAKWGFVPYLGRIPFARDSDGSGPGTGNSQGTEGILSRFGIGFLELHGRNLGVEFGMSDSAKVVPVFDLDRGDFYTQERTTSEPGEGYHRNRIVGGVEIDKIHEFVANALDDSVEAWMFADHRGENPPTWLDECYHMDDDR